VAAGVARQAGRRRKLPACSSLGLPAKASRPSADAPAAKIVRGVRREMKVDSMRRGVRA